MNGHSSTDPFWVLDPAKEVFAALRASKLAETAKPIEAARDEYVALTEQMAELDGKRRSVVKAAAEEIRVHDIAYCKLFLEKVRELGKVYCDLGDHVVSEVSIQLVWNRNCPGYYIHHTCPECLETIKAGEITPDGNIHDLHEMKEVNGNRLWLKDGEWRPLPERLTDFTRDDVIPWIDPDLAKEFGLPMQFSIAGFM